MKTKQTESPAVLKLDKKNRDRKSGVCVKRIVRHGFCWWGLFTIGAADGSSRQLLALAVCGRLFWAQATKRQTPSLAGDGKWVSLARGEGWRLTLCPGADQGFTAAHLILYLRFNLHRLFWEAGSRAGAGWPWQTRRDFSLVSCSGPPTCWHRGERRVWVVAESLGGLHGQRFDAIRKEGARVLPVVGRQVQLATGDAAVPPLLHRGDKPPLRRPVFRLRREEAAGLRHGSLAVVKAALGEVVDELVLEEGLHGVAGPGHDLVGTRRVGWRRGEAVILWSCVYAGKITAK